jgi:DNA-binding NarL/FixJ family response regulator
MATAHVLLVAQSPVLCYGIRTVLESALTVEQVTEATGALEAAAPARLLEPNLVVIHDALPGVTGDITAMMLRRLQPDATIVIMSDDPGESHRAKAIRYGADAVFSMAIDPDIFAAEISGLPGRGPVDRVHSDELLPPDIPALQVAVLDGIVRGLDSTDIAGRLQIDEAVLAAETSTLFQRLHAADRPSAVIAAIRMGLVDLHDQLPITPYAPEFGIESAA